MYRFFSFFTIFCSLPTLLGAQSYADCVTARDICEKKNYTFDRLGGEGADRREADFMHCFMNGDNHGQAEENSAWIKFEIAESGSLAFVITPLSARDDIDFVVYRLGPEGSCRSKQVVRCMAAGAGENEAFTSPCMGQTGLRNGEKDSSTDAGCTDEGDNTWLAPIAAKKGEKYLILVSNVSTMGPGFSISFSGSAMLPCDKKPQKKEKPPKKRQNPTPPVANQPSPPPSEIGGRKVEVDGEFALKSRKVTLKVWDSQVEDGDIISIYLDDKKVIDRVYLRIKPKEFQLDIPKGVHYLTVFADDFGKAEINTARVSIFDGVKEQIIDLNAGRTTQESVRIVVD